MNGRIAVDSGLLCAHAVRVGEVGSDVAQACSAVSGLNLAGGAFGVLCEFLVTPVSVAMLAGESVIGSAAAMVSRAGEQVRGWASDADQVEQAAVDTVAALQRALEAL